MARALATRCTRCGAAPAVRPVVSSTRGRVRDERERVIDVFGKPVPRLYAAGEPGGVFGHLYLSGGNFAACFGGGRVAAAETPTDGAT